MPDRFWGGIVGAFVGAVFGSFLIGLIINGFTVPGQDDTTLATALEGIPGALHRHRRSCTSRASAAASSRCACSSPRCAAGSDTSAIRSGLTELLYRTGHSLIEQSRRRADVHTSSTRDGFGLGWYGTAPRPASTAASRPHGATRTCGSCAAQIESPLFLAHVRATTGTAVQQTNCHPFRHGRWLFVHNGYIAGYARLRRELLLAVDPALFASIRGTTDSELLFHLALTFGLDGRSAAGAGAHGRLRRGRRPRTGSRAAADDARASATASASTRSATPAARRPTRSTSAPASTTSSACTPRARRFQALSEEARRWCPSRSSRCPALWHEVPPGTALIVQPAAIARCRSSRRCPSASAPRPGVTIAVR